MGTDSLHEASPGGYKEVVKLLMDRGARPNEVDKWKNTPLHLAAFFGFRDTVKILLNGGADPNHVNEYGNTPLQTAQFRGHKDVVQLLSGESHQVKMAQTSAMLHRPVSN